MGCWKSSPQRERGLALAVGTGTAWLQTLPTGWGSPGGSAPARPLPPYTVGVPLVALCDLKHVAPSQILFAPSRAPTCILVEPDIRSLASRLPRLPWLSLCPRALGSTWGGQGDEVALGGLCAACVCVLHSPFCRLVVPHSPPQQRWVPAHAEGSGAHRSLSQHTQRLPIPQQTRGWSAAPHLLDSVWAWALAALGLSPGCGAGAPWRGATARLQPPGLVAVPPASLVMSPSSTVIAGLALLLRQYSRNSGQKSICGCRPAFVTGSSCCLVTRLHFSSQLSMSCFLPLAGRRALSPAQECTWPAHSPVSVSLAEPGDETPPALERLQCSVLGEVSAQQSVFYPEPRARGFIFLIGFSPCELKQ